VIRACTEIVDARRGGTASRQGDAAYELH